MTRLFLALENVLLVAHRSGGRWEVNTHLHDTGPQDLAVDPHNPDRVYCATFDRGLWRSTDAGTTWEPGGPGIDHDTVMTVAIDRSGHSPARGVVYAGTEPSAVFRSDDGGDTWRRCHGLTDLPSAATWSFPPRPSTHHVRWIATDPHVAGRLYVAIEAGALVYSSDGGTTWQDRVPGGPRDTHTLATHPKARGRLYAAAGDGYFESHDGGATWERPRTGLRHHYCWGVAVDPTDPDTVVISAASGAHTAHNAQYAESFIYRKVANEAWQPVRAGLPDPDGTSRSVLTARSGAAGTFYAANNRGIFRSDDAGQTWARLDVPWPEAYQRQNAEALVIVPG